jgi:uridine kinase
MIIGIGGVSNSGKSALAEQIKDTLPQKTVWIVCQDNFTFPKNQIPVIQNHTDWEHPHSIDFISYEKAIKNAAKKYDVVIAEGLLIFWNDKVNALFDKRIFIDLHKDTFLQRKSNDMRWGAEPDWYKEHIWQSFLKFGQPPREENILHIPGKAPFNMARILQYLLTE